MERSCGTCRHYHALLAREGCGTCHVRPPRNIGSAAIRDTPDQAEADAVELQRWPAVLDADLCDKFRWKCQGDERCREPAGPRTGQDQSLGAIFCDDHQDLLTRWRHYRAA